MDEEKRRREDDEGDSSVKRAKPAGEVAGEQAPPGDDEVEEFFAILKRIHVAVKYFEKRKGGVATATEKSIWTPSFRREDFEGVKGEADEAKSTDDQDIRNVGLDLNLDPTSDVSDSG